MADHDGLVIEGDGGRHSYSGPQYDKPGLESDRGILLLEPAGDSR